MNRTLSLATRSLLSRPLRTLLTATAIVLGVSVILAINITNLSTLDSITDLFVEAAGKANLVITATGDGEGVPEDSLRRAGRVAGVAAAVPSLQLRTMLADDAESAGVSMGMFVVSTTSLLLYGIDPAVDQQAREYHIVEGQFLPPGDEAYEVVLVKEYADQKNLRLGNRMDVVVPGGTERLRIVGLISKEGPGRVNNGAFGVIPLKVAQTIAGRNDLDQIDVVASPDWASGARLDRLKQALQNELGDKVGVTYPAAQGKRITQMLDTYQLGLSFFSAIALFVGAFLIFNTFSMTVSERTREMGLLRAVGMTRWQVMRLVLLEASVLGIIGSALGVGGGILLAQGLIRGMEVFLSQEMRVIRVLASDVAYSVAVGLAVTLVAALVPAWQAGRVSPLEALRTRSRTSEGWFVRRGWVVGIPLMAGAYFVITLALERTDLLFSLGTFAVVILFLGATLVIPLTVPAWERVIRPLTRALYGNAGRLGSANLRRARLRCTLTATALMVGASMVLGIQGLTGTFKHDIDTWISAYIGGDLTVYSSLPVRADFTRDLEGVDGVAAVAPVRFMETEQVSPNGTRTQVVFMAVDPGSYERVGSFVFASEEEDRAGLVNRLGSGDTVFISSVIAEKSGLQPGDSIRLKTRRGDRDFTVGAVVVDFYNRGMVVEGSTRDLRRYFGVSDVSAFFLRVTPGRDPAQVAAAIDAQFGVRRHVSVTSNATLKERALHLADQGYSLFNALGLIAVVVAAFGLVNTLTMNVTERTRELGALRGLGLSRGQLVKMILAEAGAIGLIGGVFGICFGFFLSHVFLLAINALRGYELRYVMPVEAVAVGGILALVVSQLAAILPARRAANLRIVDAIQYE